MVRPTIAITLCCLIWAASSPASAQVKFILGLTVSDGADSSRTISWGVHPLATDGLDTLQFGGDTLIEVEQPPFPPAGSFEARWTDPSGHTGLGLGTRLDVRQYTSAAQVDTYRVKFQPSNGGYPFVLHWSKLLVAAHYGCPVRLTAIGAGGPVDIDMRLQDSLVIADNTINVVFILAECPGPDLIEGTLYDDTDGDGVRDGGEPGLIGWKVYLGGDGDDSTLTDVNGDYGFAELAPGAYTVTAQTVAGWIRTAPASPSYAATIGGGAAASGKDFGMFRLGVLRGFKFNDANGDGYYTPGEVKIPGWTIFLGGTTSDTTVTGPDGYYEFAGLVPGTYIVREKQDSMYVQLRPSSPGFYAGTVTSGLFDSTLQFGNKPANVFVGQAGGNWSDSSNWSSGHPPANNEAVVISVPIVIDSLPDGGTVLAIRVAPGGSVTYQIDDTLIVLSSFQIDSGGTLSFVGPAASPTRAAITTQPQVICYGSWINEGTFEPGNSVITFAGDSDKVIGPTEFYDLQITGKNTSSGGDNFADKSSGGGGSNLTVNGILTVGETFELQPGDTLTIVNPSPGAIEGTGIIAQGTIRRAIEQGATAPYRFESTQSTIQFNGSGDYPDTVSVTALPGNPQPYPYLKWKSMTSVPDPVGNDVTATDLTSFSWWTFGPDAAGGLGTPQADRQYVIHAEGGSGYVADLGLRYEESELDPGTDEATLHLLKGPYFIDNLSAGWHMVSLPVEAASAEKDSVFPASSSFAFAYEGGAYAIHSILEQGIGYWLKFNAPAQVQIEGVGIEELDDTLHLGWNLIGALSVPVDRSAVVTDPPDLLSGILYQYDGSYVPSTMLSPMKAHWVKAGGEGRLTLGPLIAKRRASVAPDLAAFGTLTVEDGRGASQVLYFGAADVRTAGRYELPPPPPGGTFSARFASQLLVARPAVAGGDRLDISSASYPVTLSWVSKPGISAELLIGTRRILIAGSGHAEVASADEVVVVMSSAAAASAVQLPDAFMLNQNYPNPFNPATVLSFDLPRVSRIRLAVYNTLGQSVSVLADEEASAGRHEARWSGAGLPSGVYFCRLTAVDPASGALFYTDVRKMLLMK